MGKVYKQKLVPVPPQAKIYSGNRVFDPPKGPIREILIGYYAGNKMMYPNENYFKLHRTEWIEFEPDGHYMVCPNTLKAGLYALTLGATQKIGVYSDIIKIRGTQEANMIMDYIMFLISERSNATYLLRGVLNDEVTFTGSPFSESVYSEFFNREMNENFSRAIMDLWLKRCINNGLESVYLAIDGSHDDCDAKENELAECGDAKSKRAGPIIGFIWAVQANGEQAGLPITYFLNRGGIVDASAVNLIVEYFKAFNVTVDGVLCDRGFCDLDTFMLLINAKLPYIVMMKKNVMGFKNMVNDYGNDIRKFENHAGQGIYGVTGEAQMFCDSPFCSTVSLFYDPARGGISESNLLKKIDGAKSDIENNIKRGVRASVPKGVKKYLCIEGKGKDRIVIIKEKAIREDFDKLGFMAIATFKKLSAQQTLTCYDFRMAIEKAFEYFKSGFGCDIMRVFDTVSSRMKFFICFMAAIHRYEIQRACNDLNLKTNKTIAEIDAIQYQLFNRSYRFVDIAKTPQINLLNELGITVDMLRDLEIEITRRYILRDECQKERDYYNALPWRNSGENNGANIGADVNVRNEDITTSASKIQDSTVAVKPKHPGGRPKGSKNKKTLAREAEEKARREAEGIPEPIKRKAGRPKGSKDSHKRTRSTKLQMQQKKKASSAESNI